MRAQNQVERELIVALNFFSCQHRFCFSAGRGVREQVGQDGSTACFISVNLLNTTIFRYF